MALSTIFHHWLGAAQNDLELVIIEQMDILTLYNCYSHLIDTNRAMEVLFHKIYCQQKEVAFKQNWRELNRSEITLENSLFKGQILCSKWDLRFNKRKEEQLFISDYWTFLNYGGYLKKDLTELEWWIVFDEIEIVRSYFEDISNTIVEMTPRRARRKIAGLINFDNIDLSSKAMADMLLRIYPEKLRQLLMNSCSEEMAEYYLQRLESANNDESEEPADDETSEEPLLTFEELSQFRHLRGLQGTLSYLFPTKPSPAIIEQLFKYSLFKYTSTNSAIVDFLLSLCPSLVNTLNDNNENALFYDASKVSWEFPRSIEVLIKYHINVNQISNDGQIAVANLFNLYVRGFSKKIRQAILLLLQAGANPNLGNKKQNYRINGAYYVRYSRNISSTEEIEIIYSKLLKIIDVLYIAGLTGVDLKKKARQFYSQGQN